MKILPVLAKAGLVVATVLRLLFGGMLLLSGRLWHTRSDPADYLATTLVDTMERGLTFGFYRPFLEGVVLPNVALFAGLVAVGEFLSGLSLTLGLATRLGAAVISFQFINYGLMGGPTGLLSHGLMIAVVALPVLVNSGRAFGVDRWLVRRWPNGRIW